MSGASIEETLELWAASLRKARMRPLFTQERVAALAGLFFDGLFGEEWRKTGWLRAAAAGDPGPWRQQAILGRGRWDADALRDIGREYAIERLAEPNAVAAPASELPSGRTAIRVNWVERRCSYRISLRLHPTCSLFKHLPTRAPKVASYSPYRPVFLDCVTLPYY